MSLWTCQPRMVDGREDDLAKMREPGYFSGEDVKPTDQVFVIWDDSTVVLGEIGPQYELLTEDEATPIAVTGPLGPIMTNGTFRSDVD